MKKLFFALLMSTLSYAEHIEILHEHTQAIKQERLLGNKDVSQHASVDKVYGLLEGRYSRTSNAYATEQDRIDVLCALFQNRIINQAHVIQTDDIETQAQKRHRVALKIMAMGLDKIIKDPLTAANRNYFFQVLMRRTKRMVENENDAFIKETFLNYLTLKTLEILFPQGFFEKIATLAFNFADFEKQNSLLLSLGVQGVILSAEKGFNLPEHRSITFGYVQRKKCNYGGTDNCSVTLSLKDDRYNHSVSTTATFANSDICPAIYIRKDFDNFQDVQKKYEEKHHKATSGRARALIKEPTQLNPQIVKSNIQDAQDYFINVAQDLKIDSSILEKFIRMITYINQNKKQILEGSIHCNKTLLTFNDNNIKYEWGSLYGEERDGEKEYFGFFIENLEIHDLLTRVLNLLKIPYKHTTFYTDTFKDITDENKKKILNSYKKLVDEEYITGSYYTLMQAYDLVKNCKDHWKIIRFFKHLKGDNCCAAKINSLREATSHFDAPLINLDKFHKSWDDLVAYVWGLAYCTGVHEGKRLKWITDAILEHKLDKKLMNRGLEKLMNRDLGLLNEDEISKKIEGIYKEIDFS